jgi:AbrB family looped-hinge helix DNA binding protein
MAGSETGRVGKRGTFVIPASLRRRFGLDEGTLIIAEERPEGILIRPAVAIATETYSPERKAAFLLENAVDAKDYGAADRAVREMGLDPSRIPHGQPPRKRPKRKARSR